MAKAAHGIQQRAFDQMAVFEGLTSTKGGKKKATFVAVGQCVTKYKKMLLNDYGLVDLHVRPAAAGTPPGNRSLQQYLGDK